MTALTETHAAIASAQDPSAPEPSEVTEWLSYFEEIRSKIKGNDNLASLFRLTDKSGDGQLKFSISRSHTPPSCENGGLEKLERLGKKKWVFRPGKNAQGKYEVRTEYEKPDEQYIKHTMYLTAEGLKYQLREALHLMVPSVHKPTLEALLPLGEEPVPTLPKIGGERPKQPFELGQG